MKEADPRENRPDLFEISIHEDRKDSTIQEMTEATIEDPDLQELIQIIETGWPESKDSLKDCCRPYYDIRDTLRVYQGIVAKGEAIVIPKSQR